jgi:S1-C subfamily serine protease
MISVQALVQRVSQRGAGARDAHAPIAMGAIPETPTRWSAQRSIGSGVVIPRTATSSPTRVVSGARQIASCWRVPGPSELAERRRRGAPLVETRAHRRHVAKLDLALLKIEETRLPVLSFASPTACVRGSWCSRSGSEGLKIPVTTGSRQRHRPSARS